MSRCAIWVYPNYIVSRLYKSPMYKAYLGLFTNILCVIIGPTFYNLYWINYPEI